MKLQILKTGLVFLALNLILVFTTNAQVGIGTTDPKSSLQVEGNPGDTTTPDGVQVPSLTITQLEGKIIGGAYGADQDGAIVYITDASIGSSISETADIKNKGFYYYFHNGVSGVWRVMGEQKIDLTNPDRVPRWDGTNLIEGSIIDSGGNVGIGTLIPDALLDVEGSFQFKDGSEGDTKLLTSDSDGNASWQSIKPENFLGTGNAPQPDFNCLSTAGSFEIGSVPESVAVFGDYVYVVDSGSDELKVIDVSNPVNPILSGVLAIGSNPLAVVVSGNYAYVVDEGSDELKVIDVSNPVNPILSGTLVIGSFPTSVTISGNYAYVVDEGSNDLKVIDVSNPASPILSGSLGIGLLPRSVAVSGDYVFVVDEFSDDLKVIDVSNPASPVLSGALGIGSFPTSVAVSDNYAYVVDFGSDDLKVINVSNPSNPILFGTLLIGSFPTSVAISGNYAYGMDQNSDDLKVIDVSNPTNPLLTGSFDIGPQPTSVAVSGNYAYVVDQGSDDLKIIELSCSPSLAINPLTGDFETVTESDPKVASSTANAIPKWDGTKLVDGTIIDSGGNVGIGITPTTNKFEVDGDVRFSSATNTTLTVQSPDNSISLIRAFGNNQGSGAIEVGQANTYGGGISYNGYLSPSFVDNEKWDHITFYRQNNGVRSAVFDYSYANDNVNFNGNITTPLLSTGHGFNELYAMNQNVQTTDNVTFESITTNFLSTIFLSTVFLNTNSIDTGLGTTEVYLMNQNVRTIDNVTFNRIRAGSGITSTEGTLHIKAQAGVFPNLYLEGGSEDIAVSTGDALQIGHWNGSSFTERLRMSSNGNFGIGRTASSNRLEVNGNASKSSSGNWQANSDARLKMNITPLSSEKMLGNLLKLKGITYEWNDDKTGNDRPQGIQYGFTAQNIQEVFPTLVNEDSLGYLQTAYGTYDAMTIEAIRALNDKIKALEKENEELKAKVDKIDQLEAMLTEIKTQLTVTNKEDFFNVEAQD